MSAAGTRGGNVRSVAEARDLQAQQKAKRDWSGVIDEQIRAKLIGTAAVHANDLDGLSVPAEHRNLLGTRMARFCNKGWMEPTTERRKVTHPAANGRRNPVYRMTEKGWRELAVGVGTRQEAYEDARPMPDADPGGQPTTVATSGYCGGDQGGDRAGTGRPLGVDPGPAPTQLQRGRDRQVRSAGSAESTGPPSGEKPHKSGRLAEEKARRNTQPARLFDPAENREPKVPSAYDPWSEAA